MAVQNIPELFRAFQKLKVLVIGDVMIDAYIWGSVSRISPEAPVPVVNVKHREKRMGGAANVALNLQSLGAEPILCAVLGNDEEAIIFEGLLEKRKITDKGIIKSQDRITTIKERVLSGSQHLLRVDSESLHPLNESEESLLQQKISDLIPEVDVIIFEDYDKGTITPNIIKHTVTQAKLAGKPIVVDPKKNNFFAYKGVDLFKPNLKELKEGMNVNFDHTDQQNLKTQTQLLRERLSSKMVMTTLSEKGVYIQSEQEDYLIPAYKRSISDVSGAGDTVISIAALCMALNLKADFVATLSNLGGGIVCEELGVVPIDAKKLEVEAIKHNLQL
ncbi:bifunctional ADP-heptose synthase [Marivirga harenae]|uniref:bifunctional heptose 7-phosphate kinase/heptose 1-phosphate adenyltransferase n=1 Tax=Marivirga harenae TaxID=2010992 RepID=UPI0026DF9B35|nr:bifunctional ADP-heptose synthase [Marivirga harenae]WKV13705.1 bifunctional ADP-heptose synthase [Marivirga harenae]|tara:strand:+ start:75168 stop:76163 length:996 start_codon:yes stop_codon:yes gene_type:complete